MLEETARLVRQYADAQLLPPPGPGDALEDLEITAPLVRAILRIRRLRSDYIRPRPAIPHGP